MIEDPINTTMSSFDYCRLHYFVGLIFILFNISIHARENEIKSNIRPFSTKQK